MIYRDSKGADFAIHAFVVGSLKIVDDTGHPLALKQGHVAMLSISLKFDSVVLKLQAFTCLRLLNKMAGLWQNICCICDVLGGPTGNMGCAQRKAEITVGHRLANACLLLRQDSCLSARH